MTFKPPHTYTPKEFSAHTGFTVRMIRTAIKKGDIAATELNRRYYVHEDELERMLGPKHFARFLASQRKPRADDRD